MFTVAAPPIRTALHLIARRRWIHAERLRQPHGAIVCGNHAGPLDALLYGEMLYCAGITPQFLAKRELFEIPVLGRLLRWTGQIPVYRGTSRARDALTSARDALARGATVTIFPEGTYTLDPDGWPMAGRAGAARLALETGVPLIPVGCWSSAEVMPVGSVLPRFWPRRTVVMRVGEPLTPEIQAGENEQEAIRRLTVELMASITELVHQTRGGSPPATPYRSRAVDRGTTGGTPRHQHQ